MKKQILNSLKQRNYQRLLKMRGDYSGKVVLFRHEDNSIVNVTMNEKSCKDHKGKPLRVGQIIQNLDAIAHDIGARDYKI